MGGYGGVSGGWIVSVSPSGSDIDQERQCVDRPPFSVCISSIVRLCYLSQIDNNDITYTLVAVGNWTSVETPLAVICACLPILPSLFRFKDPKKTNYNMSSRSGTAGNASLTRSMRRNNLSSHDDYENLDDRDTVALTDVKSTNAPEKGVPINQIKVTHQYDVV